MEGSRFNNALQVGTSAFMTLAASVLLYVAGTINVERNVNFTPVGTTTGAVLQVNGTTVYQSFSFACTNTGGSLQLSNGGSVYDTCIAASPLTTTGAITAIALDCGGVPKPFAYDVGFVKARKAGTGAGIQNLNNKTAATGSLTMFSTGVVLWNPVDYIKLGTLTSVPNAATNDCRLRVELFDKYGS